ncbi:hypothetical protein DFH07DRAFT_739785 [Mycena maculata]|uniref:THUMP domain-containing protein n=1 Tax=Mycena maculata TaxID=230809 RepID=A0AAD7JCX6_9AGAR|nr:hypothetical protein DFH07DRAFT_739785 [Mycena maculata]
MSNKRTSASQGGNDRRKKKYRSDGTPIWGKRYIDGPGVWVTCVKGKEKQAVGELYELFNGLASELWPEILDTNDDEDSDAEPDESLSIEAQIASEVSAMKRPKKEQRFGKLTNTPCVVFISCKPPVDPVKLVTTHVQRVQKTGITHTRHSLRFSPVAASCVTNIPEIQALCRSVFESFFGERSEQKFTYKIELRIRNHTTITRPDFIQAIADCVPKVHTVDLEYPELFILVEVFKAVCGVSVVRDYHKLNKFNVVEIARTHTSEQTDGITRME